MGRQHFTVKGKKWLILHESKPHLYQNLLPSDWNNRVRLMITVETSHMKQPT